MIEAVKKFCRDSKQQVPETVGEIAAVIYNSLAKCYGDTIEEIEALTGKNTLQSMLSVAVPMQDILTN